MDMKPKELDILKLAEPGKFTRVRKIIPAGSLEIRKTNEGKITFYWRGYFQEKNMRVSIGLYDPKLPPKAMKPSRLGFTINGAAEKAKEIAIKHHDNLANGGYANILQTQKEQQRAQTKEVEALKEATFKGLLMDYVLYLKHMERSSYRQVNSLFELNIFQAFPEIANMMAREIRPEHVVEVMRKLSDAGKGRSANKLYAYIHAAFKVALIAKHSASVPARFKAYRIELNPASVVTPDSRHNRSDKNPLSKNELKTYWTIIGQMTGLAGAVLQLHLLLGSPRIAQLSRLKNKDIKEEFIVLWDLKGKPGNEPRKHVLPLIEPAKNILSTLKREGEYAFSTTGLSPVSPDSISRWAREAVGTKIDNFQLKRIRSAVETYLASRKVDKETRGRLQSHGIGGVQDSSYNDYDYLEEKRHAQALLFKFLS